MLCNNWWTIGRYHEMAIITAWSRLMSCMPRCEQQSANVLHKLKKDEARQQHARNVYILFLFSQGLFL